MAIATHGDLREGELVKSLALAVLIALSFFKSLAFALTDEEVTIARLVGSISQCTFLNERDAGATQKFMNEALNEIYWKTGRSAQISNFFSIPGSSLICISIQTRPLACAVK